jgi:hypothetical protein
MPKRANEERQLLRPLTVEQTLEKSRAMTALMAEEDELAAGLKRAQSAAKKSLEELQDSIKSLQNQIHTGKHLVPVQCSWLMSTNHWTLAADDTGEVVASEPTTMADRQAELGLS